MLCEFTSAATPSAVGGSSLIAVYLHKEGLTGGEGTSIMIANLFLDELFWVSHVWRCLSCFLRMCSS